MEIHPIVMWFREIKLSCLFAEFESSAKGTNTHVRDHFAIKMASNDSGIDSSNDSSSTANDEMAAHFRQMQRSIADYMTLTEPANRLFKMPPNELKSPLKITRLHPDRRPSDEMEGSTKMTRRHTTAAVNLPYHMRHFKGNRLRMAASTNSTDMLRRLLETGVNPDLADEHSRSSLHLAASRGKLHYTHDSNHIGSYWTLFGCFDRLQRNCGTATYPRRESKCARHFG